MACGSGVLRGLGPARLSRPNRPFTPCSTPCISRPQVWARAGTETPKDASKTMDPEEARLELLEASVKGGKKAIAKARKIPIRGQLEPKAEDAASNMAPWKEGQLFPEGWEQMNTGQKATELYMGRRGVLFWANKAAYASAFILIGGWVLFRLVGPNLGLYKLAGDLGPPPPM